MKDEKSFAMQAGILASAGLITKIIGFLYRIPMANILGNTGNGIYSVAFSIYSIVLTLSSYSMPISVSKLISEKRAEGEKEADKIFKVSVIISILFGMIASLGLFLGANGLANMYGKSGLEMPLRVLALTTFIVAILGCIRGYFQGYGNMIPTAVSQIVEQIVNAVVSVVAASQICYIFSNVENKPALLATGGTIGTFAGATAALICVLFFWIKIRKKISQTITLKEFKNIFVVLISVMIPIVLSQTIYQIGYTIDDYMFANILGKKGLSETVVTNLQGVFNTQYTQLINLPVGMATAFGMSVIPRITTSYIKGEKNNVDANIGQIIKMTSMVVFPTVIGMTVCSEEIMTVLFPGLGELRVLAINLLKWGSMAAAFYSFSTVSTAILQGCNRFKTPVINSGLALVTHIVIVYLLLKFTDMNAYALLIGDIIFPMTILILNVGFIIKKIRQHVKVNNIVKPLVGAINMGIIVFCVKDIMTLYSTNLKLRLIVEVGVGVITYGICNRKFIIDFLANGSMGRNKSE